MEAHQIADLGMDEDIVRGGSYQGYFARILKGSEMYCCWIMKQIIIPVLPPN